MVDKVVLLFPRQSRTRPVKKVLWVKLDAIGDFVVWLDAAKDIRKMYPPDKWEVTILGNVTWAAFAEKLSYFDAAWPLDRNKFIKNPLYRFLIMKRVRKTGFDTVVHPTFSRQFLYGDAVVRVSGAPEKIGSQGDCTNINPRRKAASDRSYTRLIPAGAGLMSELERNAEFMIGLGLEGFHPGIPSITVPTQLPFGFTARNYYIIFPGAGASMRQWPLSRFSELSMKIHEATKWTGIICGGKDENRLGDILLRSTAAPLENWCGKTSLEELIAVVSGSRVLIGNETSGVHIAAALSKPALCILGGGHFGRFLPYPEHVTGNKKVPVVVHSHMDCYHCNWNCIHAIPKGQPAPCIFRTTVDTVWHALQPFLRSGLQQ